MTTVVTRTSTSATQAVMQLAIRLTSGDQDPIRGMKLADGRSVYSVYDAMWNTGAYKTRDAVTGAWTTLLRSEYGNEVRSLTTDLQFPGRGQRKTPCMDLRGLQRLIIILGGKIGAEYRGLAVQTLTRLVAGDMSLADEVIENAASDAPIQVAMRDALAHPPAVEAAAAGEAIAPPAAPVSDDIESAVLALSRMTPEQITAIRDACREDANAELKRAEARALVVRTEAEAAATKSAATVNEVEAYGRRLLLDKQRDDSEQQRKRKVWEELDDLNAAVDSFRSAPPSEREAQRYVFARKMEALIPSKRSRNSYVTKLVKAPAPAQPAPLVVPKAGVYVLKFEDGTYYVGESQDIDARIAQHRAGQVSRHYASSLPCHHFAFDVP